MRLLPPYQGFNATEATIAREALLKHFPGWD
jgi:hypothetical protein